jgi:hypothetical protein
VKSLPPSQEGAGPDDPNLFASIGGDATDNRVARRIILLSTPASRVARDAVVVEGCPNKVRSGSKD